VCSSDLESIFSAALTESVADVPENTKIDIPETIPDKKEAETDIEMLINMANALKDYASGLYAVKKISLVFGFFPDMGAVKLDELSLDQKQKIHAEIVALMEKQNNPVGGFDAL
jgi:hypothetical protein